MRPRFTRPATRSTTHGGGKSRGSEEKSVVDLDKNGTERSMTVVSEVVIVGSTCDTPNGVGSSTRSSDEQQSSAACNPSSDSYMEVEGTGDCDMEAACDENQVLKIISPNGYIKEEVIEATSVDMNGSLPVKIKQFTVEDDIAEAVAAGGASGGCSRSTSKEDAAVEAAAAASEEGDGRQFLGVVDVLLAAAQNDDARRRKNAEAARQQRIKQKAYIESLKEQIRELHKQVRHKEKTMHDLQECIARKDAFIEGQLQTCIRKLDNIDSCLPLGGGGSQQPPATAPPPTVVVSSRPPPTVVVPSRPPPTATLSGVGREGSGGEVTEPAHFVTLVNVPRPHDPHMLPSHHAPTHQATTAVTDIQ